MAALIAQAIVDAPDAVMVETMERESGTSCASGWRRAMVAEVIGKEGRIAEAIRVILAAVSK